MDRRQTLRAARELLTGLPPGEHVTVGDALEHQLALLRKSPLTPELAKIVGVPANSDDDLRSLLAREHYFKTWDNALAHGDREIDRAFEQAADAIVDGDLAGLQRLLAANPDLERARSAYGHRQTLLHHVGANGIEIVRQWQSPKRAPELARALLDAGADPDAVAESYPGENTPLVLVCSSAHPAAARTQAAIVDVLVRDGACVNGIAGDGAPLWTATIWGFPKAVDMLVRHRARAANLVLAAATGDVACVEEALEWPREDLPIPGTDKVLPGQHVVEYALIYAAGLRRRSVVKRLLLEKPDLSITEPIYGATARSTAQYHGYDDIVAMLKTATH